MKSCQSDPTAERAGDEFAERRVAEPGHVGPGLVGHEGHDPCAAEMVQGTAEEAVAARYPLTLATRETVSLAG